MRKNLLRTLPVALVILAMMVGANVGQYKTIEYGIGLDAGRKAEQWSTYLADTIPDVEGLISSGTPTPAQAAKIRDVVDYGDVVSFKLFDSSGRNVLSVDKGGSQSQNSPAADDSDAVTKVLQLGENQLKLIEGTQSGRSTLHAEAYVPVRAADGSVIGVAKAYLDQTEISSSFGEAATTLAIALTIMFSVALSLLYISYLVAKRRGNKVRQRADYLAKYDLTSKLHNRTGFNEKLESMQRDGQIVPAETAVMFLDIDHFKQVNDTHGHKSGDAFLRHVGAAIEQCLGPQDVAGRLGGDEFVVVAQRPDLESAQALVEQLQALVSKPFNHNGTTIAGNLSLGLHFGGDPAQSIEERVFKADLALYQAKLDGRNTYRLFTPDLELKVKRRRKVEAAIRNGLADGLFAVHFQPLLDQSSKACVGFEALLRLTDTDGESIEPAEFIPIAEATGAIKQIGAWVLASAAEAASNWPAPLSVAVNLSARQFDDENLVGLVETVLRDTGLDPRRLELEVTEGLLMENTQSVGDQLTALRALGVSIAMDDFGTGYSSLGYLWKFGFDKLKIDKSFMTGLDEKGSRAREILDTIIVLGHRLNMVVTAEGIETEAQAEVLSGLACDQFQGFLYGRPMPQADLAAFMLSNTAEVARRKDGDESSPVTGTAG